MSRGHPARTVRVRVLPARHLRSRCWPAALCGLVGVYVVLRGMSYIGHGLSHAIFGGAVVAYALSVNFYLGAFAIWGLVAALLINGISRRRTIGADAAIGVITSARVRRRHRDHLGAGVFTRNFEAAAVRQRPRGHAGRRAAWWPRSPLASAAIVFLRYRPLLFATFDPEVAEVSGVRTAWIDAPPGADARRDDHGHDERGRRHADRGGARDPAGDRAAADRQLPPDAVDLGGDRRRLRLRRRLPVLLPRLARRGRPWC